MPQEVYSVAESDQQIAEQENISLALDARIKSLESHGSGDGAGILDVVDNGDGTMTVNLTDGRAFVIALPQGPMGSAGTGGGIYPVLQPGCSQAEITAAKANKIVQLLPGTYRGDFSTGGCRFIAPGLGLTTIEPTGTTTITGDGDISGVTINGPMTQLAKGKYMEDRTYLYGTKVNGDFAIDYSDGVIQTCRYPWIVVFHGSIIVTGKKTASKTWFNSNVFGEVRQWDGQYGFAYVPSANAEATGNTIASLVVQPSAKTLYYYYIAGPGHLNKLKDLDAWDRDTATNLKTRVYFGSPCASNEVIGNLRSQFQDVAGNGTEDGKGEWRTAQNNRVIDLSPP